MRARVVPVRSLEDRIRLISEKIEEGKRDPFIHRLKSEVLTARTDGRWDVPEKDWEAEVVALFDFFRNNVRYTRDTEGLDTFQRARKTFLLGTGDCLPHGTLLIRHPYDLVPIEDIGVGDLILDGEQWTPVIQRWEKGVKLIRSFELNNACELRCTRNHRLFMIPALPSRQRQRRDAKNAVMIHARNVRVGDDLLQPQSIPPGQDALDNDRATLLGAYIADGWTGDYSVCIAGIHQSRGGKGLKELSYEAAKRLGFNATISRRWVAIYGKDIETWLAPCGHRAYEKRFPSINYVLPAVEAIVAAMNRGDGGLSTNGNMVYSTTSYDLALQYRLFQRMLGRSVSIRCVHDHGGFGKHPIYRVTVRTTKLLGRGGSVHRPWAKVLAIRDDKPAPTYDIQTVSGRIYLPESDVIVHNCDDAVISLGALLKTAGYPIRATVVGVDSKEPNHIFLRVGLPPNAPTRWPALDASVDRPPGWEITQEPDRVLYRKDFQL